jgi:hypothetical protein
MELTQGSETSANYNYNMTPGKYPKEHIQYSKHGESLKSTKGNNIIHGLIQNFGSTLVHHNLASYGI